MRSSWPSVFWSVLKLPLRGISHFTLASFLDVLLWWRVFLTILSSNWVCVCEDGCFLYVSFMFCCFAQVFTSWNLNLVSGFPSHRHAVGTGPTSVSHVPLVSPVDLCCRRLRSSAGWCCARREPLPSPASLGIASSAFPLNRCLF